MYLLPLAQATDDQFTEVTAGQTSNFLSWLWRPWTTYFPDKATERQVRERVDGDVKSDDLHLNIQWAQS